MGGGGNGNLQRCTSCHSLSTTHTGACGNSSISSYKTALQDAFDHDDLEPTALFLSSSPTSVATLDPQPSSAAVPLYLPRVGTAPCSLDVYLQSIPSVASRAHQLFEEAGSADNNHNTRSVQQQQRCLNVLQGEVAHATPDQADVLVSAEATTCHIVALRSTSGGDNDTRSVPLGSMAHIDQPEVYQECLEKMIQEHIQHHIQNLKKDNADNEEDDFGFFMGDDTDEEDDEELYHDVMDDEVDEIAGVGVNKKEDPQPPQHHRRNSSFLPQLPFLGPPKHNKRRTHHQSSPSLSQSSPIDMELHIAGGYLDEEGTSQTLSTHLVRTFSELALKYKDQIRMSLSTAAISALNSDSNKPRSRGLAMDTRTGKVTPVTKALPPEWEGPALEVRSARLWSQSQQQTPRLAVIHTSQSYNGQITIEPFDYKPQPQLNALLKVDDTTLLQVASTSPNCESERFCSDLRRTLSFVNTVPVSRVFAGGNKPLVYSRSSNALHGNQNQWEPVSAHVQQQQQQRVPRKTTSMASLRRAKRSSLLQQQRG